MSRHYFKFAIGLSLTTAVWAMGCASASADAPTDIRPVWASGQTQIPLNSSILYSNQNPSYVTGGFGTNLLPQQKVNELKQNLDDRNRNYDMRTAYGIATQGDEMDHQQSMKDMGHMVVNAARTAQVQPYGQNVGQAQKQGDIAQPLVYAGGAVGVATGQAVKMKLGKDTQASFSANAMNRQSQIDLSAPSVSASAKVDESVGAAEHYSVSVNKPLILGVNSGATFGGTSNTVSASLSRPIVGPLSASVGGSMPTNNANNPTGAVTQGTVGVNYGMKF